MSDESNRERLQPAIAALLASGFPFQTAVAHVVRESGKWRVLAEEASWRDSAGNDQFLDIVAQRENIGLAIECKKTQKEKLIFLRPNPSDRKVGRIRCLYLRMDKGAFRPQRFCAEWELEPRSTEAAFCVVSTSDSGKDQRMLEKDVQQLVRGADANSHRYKCEHGLTVVIPVLVTNAAMFVAEYDPATVSLDSGQLPPPPHDSILPADWVRFRKPFTTAGEDMGDRSVIVVSAKALSTFLRKLDIFSDGPLLHGSVPLR